MFIRPHPMSPPAGPARPLLGQWPARSSVVRALGWVAALILGAALGSGSPLASLLAAGGGVLVALLVMHGTSLVRRLHATERGRAIWERRYEALRQNVPVGIFTAASDGRLRTANARLVSLLGYPSEYEFIGADFALDVYVGPSSVAALLERVRMQGALENFEVQLRRLDGHAVVAMICIQAVWDERGAVCGFEGTVLDISSLERAESQRRSIERRFRRLVDSKAVGVLSGNLHSGTLDEANPRLLELVGLRPSELPVTLETLIPEQERAREEQVREQLRANGYAEPFATEYLHRSGHRTPVLVSTAIVDSRKGDFISVVIDCSAEVAAARKASEFKAFYELLLDNVPTMIAHFDVEQRFLYCNRAYCDWLRVSVAPIGQTLAELIGSERYDRAAVFVDRALAGETVRFELLVLRLGVSHSMDVTYVPQRDERGRPVGFLAFLHDRTMERAACGGGDDAQLGSPMIVRTAWESA